MITNPVEKIKSPTKKGLLEDLFIVFLIILVGSAAFGLGRLSALRKDKEPISIEYPPLVSTDSVDVSTTQERGKYVASQSGTKYYAVHCGSASRIKEENKVYFVSEEEARLAGFEKAENCKF